MYQEDRLGKSFAHQLVDTFQKDTKSTQLHHYHYYRHYKYLMDNDHNEFDSHWPHTHHFHRDCIHVVRRSAKLDQQDMVDKLFDLMMIDMFLLHKQDMMKRYLRYCNFRLDMIHMP